MAKIDSNKDRVNKKTYRGSSRLSKLAIQYCVILITLMLALTNVGASFGEGELLVDFDKEFYYPGDKVETKITLTNTQNRSILVTHIYLIVTEISNEGAISIQRHQIINNTILNPGKSKELWISWDIDIDSPSGLDPVLVKAIFLMGNESGKFEQVRYLKVESPYKRIYTNLENKIVELEKTFLEAENKYIETLRKYTAEYAFPNIWIWSLITSQTVTAIALALMVASKLRPGLLRKPKITRKRSDADKQEDEHEDTENES